uniref:RING-type domain-containing protein n=1 Tax=Knipowitschia caucasica TaxID=637954 RepID=A0AAV2MFA6_KNICA
MLEKQNLQCAPTWSVTEQHRTRGERPAETEQRKEDPGHQSALSGIEERVARPSELSQREREGKSPREELSQRVRGEKSRVPSSRGPGAWRQDRCRAMSPVMDLLWRILAALSFDCFKDSTSTRSPGALSSARPSVDSSSLTGSLSLGPDLPHCQSGVCPGASHGASHAASHGARLKRLSCGHLYCGPCCDIIVNQAFEDIEGLSQFPCPLCRSHRQGPAQGPSLRQLGPSCSAYFSGPYSLLHNPPEEP